MYPVCILYVSYIWSAKLVSQYLNNYNVVVAYNASRERADNMDSFIDTWYHSLLGTVTRGPFHDIIKTVEWQNMHIGCI